MPAGALLENEPTADLADGFCLGGWLVEPLAGRISRDGASVHVRPQLMDLAVAFAARQGRVVSREELFASVWPQLFVAESALARCVAELRRLLRDSARSPRIIETIPKRGYRLVAPVVPVACMAQILRDRAGQPPDGLPAARGSYQLRGGAVGPEGARYAVALEAVACASGEVLAREMIEAPSRDAVLAALDLAAARLRQALIGAVTVAAE